MKTWTVTLIVFILNNSIPTEPEKAAYVNTIKQYASQAGVELKVRIIPLKERTCTKRYPAFEQRFKQYYCLQGRYMRFKKKQLNLFVREPFYRYEGAIAWQKGGGLGAVCVKDLPFGIGVAAYQPIHPMVSAVVASHEVFHMLGAGHQENDIKQIMSPGYFPDLVEQWGGMEVGQKTKDEIATCQN